MRTNLLVAMLLAPAACAADPLPADWHGTWAGPLVMTAADGRTTEVAMELTIEPLKGEAGHRWRIVYGGDKKQVRDYKLLTVAGKPGRFVIDEGNGIRLDARLVGAVLYSQFEVQGNRLAARYELTGGAVRYEIASGSKSTPTGGKDGGPVVTVFPVDSVQVATLKKTAK